jgi:hypothetical protein
MHSSFFSCLYILSRAKDLFVGGILIKRCCSGLIEDFIENANDVILQRATV